MYVSRFMLRNKRNAHVLAQACLLIIQGDICIALHDMQPCNSNSVIK